MNMTENFIRKMLKLFYQNVVEKTNVHLHVPTIQNIICSLPLHQMRGEGADRAGRNILLLKCANFQIRAKLWCMIINSCKRWKEDLKNKNIYIYKTHRTRKQRRQRLLLLLFAHMALFTQQISLVTRMRASWPIDQQMATTTIMIEWHEKQILLVIILNKYIKCWIREINNFDDVNYFFFHWGRSNVFYHI